VIGDIVGVASLLIIGGAIYFLYRTERRNGKIRERWEANLDDFSREGLKQVRRKDG